ncbi:hypothetical protein H4219_004848 [Mycoemilia scoparia]|uniref:Sphingomyelin synthase-like domain-containing protein n=1 Tax=Mycoemilia scoparia TaxID=417184 RepID=A0A9W7ZR67_9FUNG|nr:hypothetical protein H4219_004848 [Mycoemilia scoparia]
MKTAFNRLATKICQENGTPYHTWHWPTIIRELGLLIAAWVSMLIVTSWMLFAQVISDMRLKAAGNGPPLSDLGFDLLPNLESRRDDLVQWIVNSAGLWAVIGNLIFIPGLRARIIFLRRLGWLVTIMYVLRSFTFLITTLPSPARNCPLVVVEDSFKGYAYGYFLILTGKRVTCSDCIFSGHSMVLVFSFLMWFHHARHWAFVAWAFVQMCVGLFLIVASHFHYTIDVILAIVLCCLVNCLYYGSLERAIHSRLSMDFSQVLKHCERVHQDHGQGIPSNYGKLDNAQLYDSPAGPGDLETATSNSPATTIIGGGRGGQNYCYSRSSSAVVECDETDRTAVPHHEFKDYEKVPTNVAACGGKGASSESNECCSQRRKRLHVGTSFLCKSEYNALLGVQRHSSFIDFTNLVVWMDGLHLRWNYEQTMYERIRDSQAADVEIIARQSFYARRRNVVVEPAEVKDEGYYEKGVVIGSNKQHNSSSQYHRPSSRASSSSTNSSTGGCQASASSSLKGGYDSSSSDNNKSTPISSKKGEKLDHEDDGLCIVINPKTQLNISDSTTNTRLAFTSRPRGPTDCSSLYHDDQPSPPMANAEEGMLFGNNNGFRKKMAIETMLVRPKSAVDVAISRTRDAL